MSLRERIHDFLRQRTIDEMCRLAGSEIDRGGSFHVEVGRGENRKLINITQENKVETLPELFQIITNPIYNGTVAKFTILNREHQETEEFTGPIKIRKQPL